MIILEQRHQGYHEVILNFEQSKGPASKWLANILIHNLYVVVINIE